MQSKSKCFGANYSISSYAKSMSLNFLSLVMPRLVWKLLQTVFGLVKQNVMVTLREMYYMDCATFSSQREMTDLVAEICLILECPRECLGVYATSKGYMAGSFQWNVCQSNIVLYISIRREMGALMARAIQFQYQASFPNNCRYLWTSITHCTDWNSSAVHHCCWKGLHLSASSSWQIF